MKVHAASRLGGFDEFTETELCFDVQVIRLEPERLAFRAEPERLLRIISSEKAQPVLSAMNTGDSIHYGQFLGNVVIASLPCLAVMEMKIYQNYIPRVDSTGLEATRLRRRFPGILGARRRKRCEQP
jgi:hypothetical protein